MAIFPKVQSPCPYKANLASILEGDMCGMCKRQVVDLSPMTDAGRMAFMAGCKDEVCVSYKLPIGPALAAAMALATAATPMAAAAQEAGNGMIMEEIIVGGIKDVSKIEYIEDASDKAIPEMPVIYDDAPTATPPGPDKPDSAPTVAPRSVKIRPAS